MMSSWPVEKATARFGELLDEALEKGPQVVTRQGVDTAVVVPIEEWRRLQERPFATIKDWLLAPTPRIDNIDDLIPPRGKLRRRPPVEFE